jgi:hypothetical protein
MLATLDLLHHAAATHMLHSNVERQFNSAECVQWKCTHLISVHVNLAAAEYFVENTAKCSKLVFRVAGYW